ncbi:helix-turn-helix domain-containing protein [Halobacteria archaeon AArc-curdl1]|uniref:Helix-turn-helix domain-containing protein n=1 Tax=Natronosalvus hydrolyticus TaxID=2979988 RepID=A0AAP3E7D8_9EURY|nr:helix-turn-helix domain-containing protein [Halobacteria archaeon AArc-curdl1]
MRYLETWLEQPEWMMHPMQSFIRRTDAVRYEELLAWTVDPGTDLEYELFYVDGDLEAYRPVLEQVDSVRRHTITPIDDGSFYVYVCQETRPEDAGWRNAFTDRDLVVIPPVRFDDSARMGLTVVGSDPDLQGLLEDMPQAIDVEVVQIGDFDRRGSTIARRLTDRQLEAIVTAYERGYYDVPRSGTLTDVADTLQIAESSASVTLRRAESVLVETALRQYGVRKGLEER